MNRPNRNARARMAQQTLRVLEEGRYFTEGGHEVWLGDQLAHAMDHTEGWPPGERPPTPAFEPVDTHFEVANVTTLAAARRLAADRPDAVPVALNFASAKNPGGGFINGSLAQEESLAVSSGLYSCIRGHEMYALHRRQRDAMYTDYALYSPSVPVFRGDDGGLLDAPYRCAFITAPAVNAGVVVGKRGGCTPAIREAMSRRARKVLAIAAHHGHRDVVLGAWGCGVFRNDPEVIAALFDEALHDELRGAFDRVVFAVLDHKGHIIEPFSRRFG